MVSLPEPRIEVESLPDLRRALAKAGLLGVPPLSVKAAFRGVPVFERGDVPRGNLRFVMKGGGFAVLISWARW